MNDKNDKVNTGGWLIWLTCLWLICAIWLVWQKWAAIKGLALPDTDDNLRLQQVRDWLAGQAWFDLRQHRLSLPEGADIHWSRLVDLPLAGLILLFKPFASTAFAERAAVAIAPLLPLGVTMAAAAAIIRRLVDHRAWVLAPLLLMSAPLAMAMLSPLRIDHHGWQLALLSLMVLGAAHPRPAAGGVLAGVALGLSLTIGIELLPYLGITAVIIALFWVFDRAEATRIAAFGASAAGTTALALLLFVPPSVRMIGYCDALSIAHVEALAIGGAGLFLLALLPIGNAWLRLAALAMLGAVVIAFTWRWHPQCLGDPSALIDADARQLWLANVREARPIYRQSVSVQIGALMLPVLGAIGLGIALWRSRHDRSLLARWTVVGALALFALGFCFFQTRAAPAAQVLALPGAAMLVWAVWLWAQPRPLLLRVGLLGAVIYLFSGHGAQMAAKALPNAKQSASVTKSRAANRTCATLHALQPLNTVPRGTMFTFLDLSPRLIVATRHSAIIGPYHRNGRDIADVMKAFGGTDAAAEAIVRRHKADYVLICPGVGEATIYARRAPDGFYARLIRDRAPNWLEPVPLPPTTPYRLWRVRPLQI